MTASWLSRLRAPKSDLCQKKEDTDSIVLKKVGYNGGGGGGGLGCPHLGGGGLE